MEEIVNSLFSNIDISVRLINTGKAQKIYPKNKRLYKTIEVPVKGDAAPGPLLPLDRPLDILFLLSKGQPQRPQPP
jgi:hypothetical protein